jgi:hypothetical protein
MFLYIAQNIHETNLLVVKSATYLLNVLGLPTINQFVVVASQALAVYTQSIPVWGLLTVVMLIREMYSVQTTRLASNTNNVFKKTQN